MSERVKGGVRGEGRIKKSSALGEYQHEAQGVMVREYVAWRWAVQVCASGHDERGRGEVRLGDALAHLHERALVAEPRRRGVGREDGVLVDGPLDLLRPARHRGRLHERAPAARALADRIREPAMLAALAAFVTDNAPLAILLAKAPPERNGQPALFSFPLAFCGARR